LHVGLRVERLRRYITNSEGEDTMRTHAGWWWLSAIVGCATVARPGADPQSDPPHVESSGAEVGAQSAPPVAAAQPSGPASVLVRALVNGRAVAAHVRVLDANGGAAIEAVAGDAPLELLAGTYRAEVTVDDAAVLADRPTQSLAVFVPPGKQTLIEATFPWSKIQLNVIAQGRSFNGTTVRLMRGGVVVAEMKSGAQPALISPGKYEADVLLHGATIHVKGLLFPENGAQTVPVHVQF
jgi:hypothetical protein